MFRKKIKQFQVIFHKTYDVNNEQSYDEFVLEEEKFNILENSFYQLYSYIDALAHFVVYSKIGDRFEHKGYAHKKDEPKYNGEYEIIVIRLKDK